MTLTNHVKYATLAALALAPFLRRRVVPFWLAAVFIDLDHLPSMVRRCGPNPLALVRFALTFRLPAGRPRIGLRLSRPLHHPLLPAVFLALALRRPAWLGVGLGLVFHLALDRHDHRLGLAQGQRLAERQERRCLGCGRFEELLQAHHRDLRRCPPQGQVSLDDLIGLCDRCHGVAHMDLV